MKRNIVIGWMLILLVFILAIAGVVGSRTAEKEHRWVAPDAGVADSAVTIRAKIDGTVEEMTMDTYLQGVLSAEMPAAFELEALKAQAVAARTETMHRLENGPVAKHPEADICNDINCCQAYKSPAQMDAIWGADAENYRAKIATAVRETDGLTILYEDKPILAVFFSSASGETNRAGDVWLQDLPYLQSVESPENEGTVPNYYSVETLTPEEFRETFLKKYPAAKLDGKPESWFGEPQLREGSAMVLSIPIGGISVKGTELRSLFGLRSAAFTISVEKGEIVIRTTGYGHGVGMSQYGAQVLAGEGKTMEEILHWYYTDVTIAPYTPKILASAG